MYLFFYLTNPTLGLYSTDIKVPPLKDIVVMIFTAPSKHGENPDYT